jgi:hypothetical protein
MLCRHVIQVLKHVTLRNSQAKPSERGSRATETFSVYYTDDSATQSNEPSIRSIVSFQGFVSYRHLPRSSRHLGTLIVVVWKVFVMPIKPPLHLVLSSSRDIDCVSDDVVWG